MFFDSFNGFDFMFDNLAQDITVITTVELEDEDLGTVKRVANQKIKLHEPILNTQNPNVTYQGADGGQYPTTVYYLESRHSEFKKGDEVVTTNNHFKITAKADDVASGLWYYTLKRVGDDDFVQTNDKGPTVTSN